MKDSIIALGLMSGTSMDGVDLALCRFGGKEGRWHYEILLSECVPYEDKWANKLKTARDLGGYELLRLHKEYGFYLGELVNSFLEKHREKPELIGSHGHTIFHNPAEHISFQLGDGASISAVTSLKVICDFRALDVCLEGQGAPLVPLGDELLFSEYDYCLNLGGIANISYSMKGKRLAYDICPCNILLNHYARQNGAAYDKGGEFAKCGKINEGLDNQLNNWKYYALPAPKSLDKDTLCNELIPLIDAWGLKAEDVLATLVNHIADQINNSLILSDNMSRQVRILTTGGGALNEWLIQKMTAKQRAQFIIPDAQTINFKEALLFAFLGVLRAKGNMNTLATVTGAKRDSSGGGIYG